MLYFAAGVGFLDSTTTTVMRSMIISIVPANEIGKVFCVVEFFKGIIALTGPVIYGYLYEKTLRTCPEAFLYLSSACKCVVFIVGFIIYVQLSKREKQKQKEKYSHKKDDLLVLDKKEEVRQELVLSVKDSKFRVEQPSEHQPPKHGEVIKEAVPYQGLDPDQPAP